MKKLIAIVMMLALFCGLAAAPALADRKIDAVALLVSSVNGEVTVTGSAVCVEIDGGTHWITATGAMATGQPYYLLMEDMSYAMIENVTPLGTGLAAELQVNGSIRASSVPLTARSVHASSESCIGYMANAALLSTGAERFAATVYADGTEGVTCTSMEGLLPGAAMFDEDGSLSGLITSALGEGEGRYIALDAPALRTMLGMTPPAPVPDKTGGTTWISDIPYSFEGGYLLVDFAGQPAEGQYIRVWCFDSGNDFYRWASIEPGKDTGMYFPAVPGRTLTLYAAANPDAEVDDAALTAAFLSDTAPGTSVTVPNAGTEMPYGYQQECYLAVTPKSQAVGETERLPAADHITRELLTDPDQVLWLQVNCTYTVTEDSEDTLLCCLYDPNGSVITHMAGFVYGVSYMNQDDWHVDMTDEFRFLNDLNGLPGGTYTLCYYVGSVLAGSFTFTLPGDTVEDGGDSI